jgi:mRNA interferase MazF
VARAFIPDAGDVVWLDFTPQTGHAAAVNRPALVLSPAEYNDRTDLMVCCPLTARIKDYPFEVRLAGGPPLVALADQVRSFDWRTRRAVRKGKVTDLELAEVRAKIGALIGFEARTISAVSNRLGRRKSSQPW